MPKGSRYERELVDLLWKSGFAAVRVAGSGSSSHPAPDVIAGRGKALFAIEVKYSSGERIYLGKEEVNDLLSFSNRMGAKPLIGVRFRGTEWRFLDPSLLKERRNTYLIEREEVIENGIRIQEIL